MSLQGSTIAIAQHVNVILRRLGRTTLVVVLLWAVTLWWGERTVFQKSVASCEWSNWESWPPGANPHHVLFVADPQLVDPHTYPGRPWPLSTLTVLYTDLYMRRVYGYLLDQIQPHTTLFLGDLFDGGREWAAAEYESPIARYKKYGTDFWLREYTRFMNMFIGGWYDHEIQGHMTGEGRRIIASLPGNHDLGFASGINEHVRDRFEAHFGPSNRVDILGNHTFVSLDTVSLSAMDQVDPVTGGSGGGDGTGHDTKHMQIWKPVEGFLNNVKSRRAKAVQKRYHYLKALSEGQPPFKNRVLFNPKAKAVNRENGVRVTGRQRDVSVPSSNFPTILLTHVPLYRNEDVTCGPLRERGNAIPLTAGYQYQNVLTPAVSKDIVDHLDAEQITMIYSGDDHDYCEIEHGEFTGQMKEITVKSISWAMGVRKPGVQLASLWNPIDLDSIAGGQASTSTPRDTVQNHLCLLPDQLAIFIRYGQILVLTLLVLFVRVILYHPERALQESPTSPAAREKSEPLLPLTRKRTPPSSPYLSTTDLVPQSNNTSTPTHTARSRSNGKLNGYGNLPASSRSTSPSPIQPAQSSMTLHDTDDWGMPKPGQAISHSRTHTASTSFSLSSSLPFDQRTAPTLHNSITNLEKVIYLLITPASSKVGEFIRRFNLVAGPVLLFYFWLLWNG